jgi:hypothetical protein
MYFDSKPCSVCGAEVRLVARKEPVAAPGDQVGDPDGFVGDGDSTVDERVCTNPECPANAG